MTLRVNAKEFKEKAKVLTIKEMAEEYGVSSASICNYYDQLGIPRNHRRGNPQKLRKIEFVEDNDNE